MSTRALSSLPLSGAICDGPPYTALALGALGALSDVLVVSASY